MGHPDSRFRRDVEPRSCEDLFGARAPLMERSEFHYDCPFCACSLRSSNQADIDDPTSDRGVLRQPNTFLKAPCFKGTSHAFVAGRMVTKPATPRRIPDELSYERSSIARRRLKGRMSVQTRSMYSKHSSLVPVFIASSQPGAFGRCASQIEYCSSWLTTTL